MTRTRALAMAASLLIPACGGSEPVGPGATATLSGVVSAAAGPAIAGASVQVGSATAMTGADGRFQLQNLPVGSVTLVTTAPGFDARSETVSLAAGTNAHDVLLTPTPTATLAGVVTAGSGAVIAGASVTVGSSTATSGADGSFQLENLPVGNATVVTSAPGFDPRTEAISLSAGVNAHDIVLTAIPIATVSGVVSSTTGAPIAGASVSVGTANGTTGADGRFELQVRAGTMLIGANAPGFAPQSEPFTLVEGANTRDIVLPPAGTWGFRAPLIEPNSELALAELNGKLYMFGGYPATRVTSRAVQVYDIAGNSWTLGSQLPLPNNHGMAASVNGKIYLIGGQTSDASDQGYQNTVYELDPAVGQWVTKAPMPTARGAGVAVVLDGKIYVAGGRPPRGNDFAVYDPAADSWEVLPDLPTQRNHFTGAAIDGRIHYVGGRQGHGLSPLMTTVHEVYDPEAGTWTTMAPMRRARSGMNGVMARGCFHVWGGEGPAGMFPDHDYYDPRTDRWVPLLPMSLPVHGVYGSAFVGGLIWVPGGGTNIGGNFGSTQTQVHQPEVSCE
jgi:N-acetylneuraminic acid mutarotase